MGDDLLDYPPLEWPHDQHHPSGMSRLFGFVMISLSFGGCAPGGPPTTLGNGTGAGAIAEEGGACTWPSAFNSTGLQPAGTCRAQAVSGRAEGGTLSCSSTEYILLCAGEPPVSTGTAIVVAPAPGPSSSLGCRGLPLPTAEGVSYYCCPCGQGINEVNPLQGVSPSDASVSSPSDAAGGTSPAAAGDANAPTTCSMPAADLDHSCTSDSDCVAVPGGDPCNPNCEAVCKTTVVNTRVAAQYVSDFKAREVTGGQGMICGCPCLTAPFCCNGTCENHCGGCGGP